MDQGTHDTPPAIEWASDALRDVAAERRRQIEAEGWTPSHDDEHSNSSLAEAAGCYALWGRAYPEKGRCPGAWPWEAHHWNPKEPRANYVRASALLLAEIERLDRATEKPKWQTCKRCDNPTYCRESLRGCDLDEIAR